MTLMEPQISVLRLIASNQFPNSLFTGGAVANRDGHRISQDLDIEHSSVEAVRLSYDADRTTLSAAGYYVRQTGRSQPRFGFIEAAADDGRDEVLLDWTLYAAVRFFPAIPDDLFGWRLHDADVALNKLLAPERARWRARSDHAMQPLRIPMAERLTGLVPPSADFGIVR